MILLHFLLLKPLLPGPEPVQEREACYKTASTKQTQLLVGFPAVPSAGEAAWKILSVTPNRTPLLAEVWSRAALAVPAPPSELLVPVWRCCGPQCPRGPVLVS